MSDTEQLLCVLAAFTLGFGTVWVRPGGVLFVSQGGERHRPRWLAGHAVAGNGHGGLLVAGLFPPGSSVVAAPWPVSVSPAGAAAYSATAPTPDGRPDETGEFVPFADLRETGTDGRTLLVNGRPFLTAQSKTAAARWAGWLTDLRDLPESKRQAWIDRALAESLDPAAAGRAFAAVRRATRWLRACSTVLFAYCYLALGLPVFAGVAVPLRPALAGYAGLAGLTFLAFRRVERASDRPSGHGWMILVSPVDAFRAADQLVRPALEVFHPLALSGALAGPAAHDDFARRVVRDVAHPLRPDPGFADPRAAEAVAWFAGRVRAAVWRAVRDADRYLTPPLPDDPTAVGYCPRCGSQFVRESGACSDCGTGLLAFAGPPGTPARG